MQGDNISTELEGGLVLLEPRESAGKEVTDVATILSAPERLPPNVAEHSFHIAWNVANIRFNWSREKQRQSVGTITASEELISGI